jgi:hypothetical protein
VVRSRLQENEIRAQLQRTLEGIEPGMPIKIESWQDALSMCCSRRGRLLLRWA